MRWAMLLAGTLTGCVFEPADSGCEDLAIHDADGNVDDCDLAACEACAEACGAPCAILESFPPQYSCDAGGSWTVYDECPDWEPPDTGA